MPRSQKILGFLLVTLLAAYGCAKGPADPTEKNASPEAKLKRAEEDARAAAAARDQFRLKLIAAEARETKLQKQLDAERQALRAEVKTRTTERDAIATQFDGFRKSLKELIAQAEGTPPVPSLSQPPTSPVGTNTAPLPSELGSGTGN